MYYLIFSVGQETRIGLAEWFWLTFSHEVAVKLLTRTAYIPQFNEAERTTSKLTHMVVGRPQFHLFF